MTHDTPMITLNQVSLGFGGPPLINDASVSVHLGERICLVGRNGAGKSSLMRVLAGANTPDSGTRVAPPSARITYLSQTPSLREWPTALDAVLSGLGDDQAELAYLAESYLRELEIPLDRPTESMSGGEERKVALARALISDPHVLLLDEPTNHLDLPSIEWLERTLKRLSGAVVLISHDRALLERCTSRTWWVERGELRNLNHGFKRFELWRDEVYHAEDQEVKRMDKTLVQETQWLREGISARRTRNQGRLRRLMQLRQDRASHRKRVGKASLTLDEGERSGRVVINAEGICKSYGDRVIFAPLDLRVMRGDRIGIIGPNGAGKSTLIKVLCGDLEPDSGSVELGSKLQTIYIDQHRDMNPELTLAELLCVPGSDRVMVHGQPRHVASYLRDFLFSGGDARRRIKSLSGGERARLLLAQQLAEPANLLILDEPTNDLDLETLELLQDLLGDYEGTVLMVSHDRDFLDRVVTSTLAFESDGRVVEYAGGYRDMIAQRALNAEGAENDKVNNKGANKGPNKSTETSDSGTKRAKRAKTKLSYREQQAYDAAQQTIDRLESSISEYERELDDPTLFERDAARFELVIATLERERAELEEAEETWLELEMLREELAGGNS